MSNFPDAHKVYELAAVFRERVIEQGRSFLWPDQEIWTNENAEHLLKFESTITPEEIGNSFEPLAAAIAAESITLSMLAADAQAVCHLYWASTVQNLNRRIRPFIEQDDLPPVDELTFEKLTEQTYMGVPASFTVNKSYYFEFHLSAVVTLNAITTLSSSSPTTHEIESAIKQEMEQPRSSLAREHYVWQVAHVLFPTEIVPLPSARTRRLVLTAFSENAKVSKGESEFTQLNEIREFLASKFEGDLVDFYDPRVYLAWETSKARIKSWMDFWGNSEANITVPPQPEHINGDIPTDDPVDTIAELSKQTFLPESFLHDIESLLESKKQLIFEGPPGSGKTYVAEQFARYFTGQSLTAEKTNDQVELIQFHQSYSYEDFVEGIRPRMDGGQLVYHVEAGIFLRLVARAAENPQEKYVLIVDEINRGNVSRILGELMLLLEYRDKSATLPYSKDPLQIPDNLYIIGTMNTADRSLSQIDYALRRRFYFVRFMSVENGAAPVLDGWLRQKNLDAGTHASILQKFIALNQQLEKDIGTDDLQVGHSYFMDDNIHNDRQQQHIWTYAVLPLIREYLYHHRERESLLDHYRWDRLARISDAVFADSVPPESFEPESSDEASE